jgi:hypothetical protein
MATGEQYIFDPRSSNSPAAGLVFGLTGNAGSFRPSTWAIGDVAQAGGGGVITIESGPTVALNAWSHIAWVKQSSDANNLYIYHNGVSLGTIPCGTNASTTSDWSRVLIGNILGYFNSGFHFRGRIGGLKVSNVALYSSAFSAPSTLNKSSTTVLLLGPDFKEIVGNVTLTTNTSAGTIQNYTEKVDISVGKIVQLSDIASTMPKQSDIYGIYTPASILSTTAWGCQYGLGPNITINSSVWYNTLTSLVTLTKSTHILQ